MPDISPTYQKIADNNIALLHIKCTRGIFSDNLFRMVARGNSRFYTLDRLEWMKEFLPSPSEHIAAGCLDCLCSHGFNLNDARDIIAGRIKDKIFSNKVIEIAERQNNPDILLLFMEESDGYLNRVILALKKTGNDSYLTTLMLSENETLARAVNRIAGGK